MEREYFKELSRRLREEGTETSLADKQMEHNYLKESVRAVRKEALHHHVNRIFDNPRWVDFVPFNRRYRPEVLKTAHLVTVVNECCQEPGVVTQEQIDAAYKGTIS